MTTPPAPAYAPSLRTMLPTLVIDGLCPFATYRLLTMYVPGMSQMMALGLGAMFPATKGIVGICRRRRLDIIGAIVLTGIAVSVLALWAGSSPRVFLMRESFVTGALGLLALSSFAWPRPLFFYLGQQFAAGQDAIEIERFNALWQRPAARTVFRVLTLVWALGWLGEFALRIVMVLTLSIGQVLAVSPVVFKGITIGLIAWTLAYVRGQRRRRQDMEGSTSPPA